VEVNETLTNEELTEAVKYLRQKLELLEERMRSMEKALKYAGEICTWPEEDYQLHLSHPLLWKPAPQPPLPSRLSPK
jgi:5-bromo-4-chloroindolyl phosphate hydrolysis protein